MVQSADGVELLADVGVERRITGSADVEIRGSDGRWRSWEVKVVRHSPSPTEIQRALDTMASRGAAAGVLFVVPRAGAALRSAASAEQRVAYAAVEERVVSIFGELLRSGSSEEPQRPVIARPSWVRFALLRVFALAGDRPQRQSALARRLGVSHVAVAKQLPSLGGLVERTPQGWVTSDRSVCWDRFMTEYPGPLGLANFWTSTSSSDDQLKQLERVDSGRAMVIALSGDRAADYYAPWRRPNRITAYVTAQLPLEDHGFVEVPAEDATVETRVAKDPTVLPMTRELPGVGGAQHRYVDPLLAAWDLARNPGGDVQEAVERLRERALAEPLWR